MNLSKTECKYLEKIQEKIILNTATTNEMQSFLSLIVKSDNELEMLNYMETIGLNSIKEIQDQLNKNNKDENLTTGLVIAGGAILLALLLSR
ncbi:hypothetical protein CRYPA_1711 [uncultured Candidatus Thioglobus sp.]|nr:hypothetical protein CRYPA_1711 [uncultured Candidatus Thioglobus sp.]